MNDKNPSQTEQPGSRRALMRAGIGVVAGAAAIATIGRAGAQAPAAATKVPQASVQYQTTPKNGQLCALCANFVAPNSCQVVDGKISPTGWCVAFAPKG